jgi:hypothetical protein
MTLIHLTDKILPTLCYDFSCFFNELVFILNPYRLGGTVREIDDEIVIAAFHNTGKDEPLNVGIFELHCDNSGDISWHKNRIFINEVFHFEELGFKLITPGFYRVRPHE